MKQLLLLATLATLPALAQTPAVKPAKRAQLPMAVKDTTLGHKFKTKSRPTDGPTTMRMLSQK